MITIGIYGMGYVGLTTAACLISRNYSVIGYEISEVKRAQLAQGKCPLSEPGVEAALADGAKRGLFRVSAGFSSESIPDIVLICVGTPNAADGSTDLRAVRAVFAQLADGGRTAARLPEIVLRSTVPPGTLATLKEEVPTIFTKTAVVFYPEFLREGTAIRDFFNPPQTILGVPSGGRPPIALPTLLTGLGLEYDIVSASSAEFLKFACNAYHAVKVAFGNEVGRVAAAVGADGAEIMRLFVRDTQLNISAYYLMPGGPYGGSCLPKECRAFVSFARKQNLELPLISGCERSNDEHLNYIVNRIADAGHKRIALLGLAFKKDTDDVRESPSVNMVRALSGRTGISIKIHDFLVRPDTVVGVNRDVLHALLAETGCEFVEDLDSVSLWADCVVVMHGDARYRDLPLTQSVKRFDVARWRL